MIFTHLTLLTTATIAQGMHTVEAFGRHTAAPPNLRKRERKLDVTQGEIGAAQLQKRRVEPHMLSKSLEYVYRTEEKQP